MLSERSRSFRSLDYASRIEWLSRVISNVHAVILTGGMSYAIFCEPANGIYAGGDHEHRVLIRSLLILSLGYFVYDSLLVLFTFTTISNPLVTLVHHTLCLVSVYTVLLHDAPVTAVWCAGMYLTEASTPFVNQRWFMAIRHRHQKRYKATGLLMTVIFLLVRPVGIPLFMAWLLRRPQLYLSLDGSSLLRIWKYAGTACALLYAMNIFWSVVMVRGLFKAFHTPRPTHETSVRNGSAIHWSSSDKDSKSR